MRVLDITMHILALILMVFIIDHMFTLASNGYVALVIFCGIGASFFIGHSLKGIMRAKP